MRKTYYIFTLFLTLISCRTTDREQVGECCDKTYDNLNEAIKCFSQTSNGNLDERLLLIAFVNKDLEVNQKLGWNIIKDSEIVKVAKRNYALVITDINEYKIPTEDCGNSIQDCIKKNSGKTFFIITNKAQCMFSDWTIEDSKQSIIDKLEIGNGP